MCLQYGWLDIGAWTVVDHYSADADTSRLEGMLSALPADLDGDGQEELLLVRLEQEGGRPHRLVPFGVRSGGKRPL